MRLMGLDYGDRNIGVAVSDAFVGPRKELVLLNEGETIVSLTVLPIWLRSMRLVKLLLVFQKHEWHHRSTWRNLYRIRRTD